jgi:hypothetical protein
MVLGVNPKILTLATTGKRVVDPEAMYFGTITPDTLDEEYCAESCKAMDSNIKMIIFFMMV